MPVIPHKEAGCLIEPPVSVPVAAETIPAATAAADPPELPPGTKFCPHGLSTLPKKLVSLDDPMANSSILVLPIDIHPAASRFSITVAEYGGMKFESIFEPQVVLKSLVTKRSFWATGIPDKLNSEGFLSNSLALIKAFSLSNVIKAFKCLLFSTRLKVSIVNS